MTTRRKSTSRRRAPAEAKRARKPTPIARARGIVGAYVIGDRDDWLANHLQNAPDDGRQLRADALAELEDIASRLPDRTAFVASLIIDHGASAAADAVGYLAEHPTEGGTQNVLSSVGNAIAKAARRAVLTHTLDRQFWNLTRTAEVLRMGTPGAVLRAIRDLDLLREYEAAKGRGQVTQAWNRKARQT